MSKDPAVLFYINDWLISTSEMDADCRGWYLNLLLHNYDKNDLPNDIEKLAVLAGVKFSEFDRFKQVFEQVLKQKFEQTESNRLTNLRASKIMRSRETFKDKRSTAGKMSYLMKYFAKNYTKEYKNNKLNEFVKKNINTDIDIKNEQVLKQVFEHLFELYRNENENENKDEIKNVKIVIPAGFETAVETWLKYKSEKNQRYKDSGLKVMVKKLVEMSNNNPEMAIKIVEHSMSNNYDGLFPPKNSHPLEQRSGSGLMDIDCTVPY